MTWDTSKNPIPYLKQRLVYYNKKKKAVDKMSSDDYMISRFTKEVLEEKIVIAHASINEKIELFTTAIANLETIEQGNIKSLNHLSQEENEVRLKLYSYEEMFDFTNYWVELCGLGGQHELENLTVLVDFTKRIPANKNLSGCRFERSGFCTNSGYCVDKLATENRKWEFGCQRSL